MTDLKLSELIVRIDKPQRRFLDQVRGAMIRVFGNDRRRIDHALRVAGFAEELLAYVDADPVLTLAAAYLHDIGIHAAERKHGSSSGKWQELEGPPIARELLGALGADELFIAQVAEIVGRHHTPRGVDSPEFRILWDADALVNFSEVSADKTVEQVETLLRRHMVTEPGFRIGRQLFTGETHGKRS